MSKKILFFLLVFLLAVFLIACGEDEKKKSSKKKNFPNTAKGIVEKFISYSISTEEYKSEVRNSYAENNSYAQKTLGINDKDDNSKTKRSYKIIEIREYDEKDRVTDGMRSNLENALDLLDYSFKRSSIEKVTASAIAEVVIVTKNGESSNEDTLYVSVVNLDGKWYVMNSKDYYDDIDDAESSWREWSGF